MPKRKLAELNGSARPDNDKARKLSMKAVRLANKFDQGVQLISKALKTARGFERQKLSRREKTAKSQDDSATLTRLSAEVEALKGLDYQITSQRYLFKQLSKTKRIAEAPVFKEFEGSRHISTEGPKSTAESNILGRLFKSTPVKNVLPKILAEIRTLLGISDVPTGKQDKTSTRKDAMSKSTSAKKQKETSASDTGDENDAHPAAPKRRMDVEGSGEDESEDFGDFDARLASGSNSEDDDDEDSSNPRKPVTANDISDSVSRSPSPTFSDEQSPPPKKAKGSKEPAQQTTFLPSLMMGGYWSGSESEATDDEQAAGPPKRKNRMGQQARRALWEKKYGDKANHIQQEQKKQRKNRDSGWDLRRGGYRRLSRRTSWWTGRNRPDSQGGQREKPKVHHKDNTGPLHPSWEAKKKQKEQATATFSGTKVTFD
ncbi:hypothetical protein N7468_007362 [Penicillium chermesinum]|uniref:Bud22 domain-containing protein n=1 Tax=Penicillium chermesinum TaxID=63820 RepID=A0A9W9NTX9_9EURO|nr:uncharacterized protein N7468_007362 [Penicillium chermesinum]KAJ5226137.1 hypothetical protein N7468_007362 [Penicillium chermesinum]